MKLQKISYFWLAFRPLKLLLNTSRVVVQKSQKKKLGMNVEIIDVFRNCLFQDGSRFFQPVQTDIGRTQPVIGIIFSRIEPQTLACGLRRFVQESQRAVELAQISRGSVVTSAG